MNLKPDDKITSNSKTNFPPVFITKGDKQYLLRSDNTISSTLSWSTQPEILSYLFIKVEFGNQEMLYDILGKEVKDSKCSRIIAVLGFWVVFYKGSQMCVGRLIEDDLHFKISDVLKIENYGLLSNDGLVVKINGVWTAYRYSFGYLEDRDKVNLQDVTQNRITQLLASGFSSDYLMYLFQQKSQPTKIDRVLQVKAWTVANAKCVGVLKDLSHLASHWRVSDIKMTLNLSASITCVLRIYTTLRDVSGLK
jgi:hypothetical protein